MSDSITLDEARDTLEEVRAGLHAKFAPALADGSGPDPLHRARLEQLDQAIATATMAVEHLHDEDVRHRVNPRKHAKATGAYVEED